MRARDGDADAHARGHFAHCAADCHEHDYLSFGRSQPMRCL